MQAFKKIVNITGLVVFVLALAVYIMTAERTGSLWDCGEFILGAYKLQVVHPPGAGLFILVGRLFTWVATLFSDNPSNIAFAVNIMSAICGAASAMFMAWVAMIFGKIALVGRNGETSGADNIALLFVGLVGGLSSAWITSTWFNSVEGEVYAMSTFFTALTIWSAVKWYELPDKPETDRWLIFSFFAAGLSIGVHLLSLLVLPAIAMMYYYKKYNQSNAKGLLLSIVAGVIGIAFVQKFIIAGLPALWQGMELFTVNTLGLPIHSGIVPTIALIAGVLYYIGKLAHKYGNQLLQNFVVATVLILAAYSVVGIVVIRANADTPVNMNVPSDVMTLLPYLNREQYGERPLLKGPHYLAQPVDVKKEPRYGRVGDEYKIVDEKYDYVWKNSDKIMFPRIGHQDKIDEHKQYKDYLMGNPEGKPSAAYNFRYFLSHQLGYMYWRYFMWNFAGRQNSDQGTGAWDKKDGNWISGFSAVDDARLYDSELLPQTAQENPSRNKYYFIPLILGILGLVFQLSKSTKEFSALLMMFLITGIGIIIYSNQPPIEPRERDYVLVGSFITFCIWIGLGVLAIYEMLTNSVKLKGMVPAAAAGIIGLASPAILVTQNYDDHDRSEHFASRDYAANFLNSVDKNAIIFTYGDNDTYPLWYAQEVENIRRDVRVVNLSLIQVDWYINKLRNKVNDSPPIKLSISEAGYKGKNLNQMFFANQGGPRLNLIDAWKNAANSAPNSGGYPNVGSKNFYIPFDRSKATPGLFNFDSLGTVLDSIPVSFGQSTEYLTKDDVAILDLVASNIHDRPVYFSVTCRNEKLHGLNDYMQLEGLGLRVVPSFSPSDRSFSIYGSGKVETTKLYNHVMKDWKYGNFDKIKTHVDKSYLAAVQSMKLVMLRGAYAYLNKQDNAKAAQMANMYFEKFPPFNFPYDAGVIPFIDVLVKAKDYANAKKHIKGLALESKAQADFLQSINKADLGSFGQDINMLNQAITDCKNNAAKVEDAAFAKEINDLLGDRDAKIGALLSQFQ
jgi:hypothetical protein